MSPPTASHGHSENHAKQQALLTFFKGGESKSARPQEPIVSQLSAAEEAEAHAAVISWNVAGWASTYQLITSHYGSLEKYFDKFQACAIFCIQETKVASKELFSARVWGANCQSWTSYWACNRKSKGKHFNGVATWVKIGVLPPVVAATQDVIGDKDLDDEGRCLLTDHGTFCVFNVYAPYVSLQGESSGQDATQGELSGALDRKLRFLSGLQKRMEECRALGRRVIVVGDLNLTYRREDCHPSNLHYYVDADGSLTRSYAVGGENKRRRLSKTEDAGQLDLGSSADTLAEWSCSWRKHKELLDAGVPQLALEGAGETFHARNEPGNVDWLRALLAGSASAAGEEGVCQDARQWVDVFAACHSGAKNRFTSWMQKANARYTNLGKRLDYTIVDAATFADCVVPSPSAVLGGCSEEHPDACSAEAALNAATNHNRWHAAATTGAAAGEGLQLQRDNMRLNDSQFPPKPMTGILYTPPAYSDHVAVSLLLRHRHLVQGLGNCKDVGALAPPSATRSSQPWSGQRTLAAFCNVTPRRPSLQTNQVFAQPTPVKEPSTEERSMETV
mmetsp:Transcript_13399/g.31460  ORF Transcript_13399/g.31460 Transcript_13399/m.31460 type:complete len:562 (+) Transcript_13399:31-1716(+)